MCAKGRQNHVDDASSKTTIAECLWIVVTSWYFKLHPQTMTAWNYGWACMRRENDRMVWLINWRHEHAKEKSSRLEKCVIFFMDKNESTDLSPNGSLSDGWCLMTDRFPSLRSHVISAEITTHLWCHFHFHCQTAWCYNGNKIRTARYHRSGKCPQEYIHSKNMLYRQYMCIYYTSHMNRINKVFLVVMWAEHKVEVFISKPGSTLHPDL